MLIMLNFAIFDPYLKETSVLEKQVNCSEPILSYKKRKD